MQTPYWEYFLALEDDLISTSRFVEFAPANMEAFSIEFVRILLAAAAEVDVVAKELCNLIDPAASLKNINDYRPVIITKFPQFCTCEIGLPRYSIHIKPWEAWGGPANPPWWRSYNSVKHERSACYDQATLMNAISSCAGLFCMLLYYYKLAFPGQFVIDPPPRLFTSATRDPSGWSSAQIHWDYYLPDKF